MIVTVAQLGVAIHVLLALGVSAHIVLTKTDVRAAIGWTGLVWLAPVLGSVIYLFLGINRIRRRVGRLRPGGGTVSPVPRTRCDPALLDASIEQVTARLRPLATLVGAVSGAPLTHGNAVDPLVNGDAAYPAMVAAIDTAERSVALVTYIFDHGAVADMFLGALERAVKRGVAVRVLIDGVGARYSHPPVVHALRARGVTVATFLPSAIPVAHPFFNLRNHRKLLLVDGAVGFCGGLNIRDGCMLSLRSAEPTQDLHFRVRGDVVAQLMTAVAFDWHFMTGEVLEGDRWSAPAARPAAAPGTVRARGIADGPDEDFEALLLTLLGAIATASRSVRIVTPYFLPDAPLVDAIKVAALRGVRVEIVLPERGNLRVVQWAQAAQLSQVLRDGVRVFLAPPPFDHSKLLIVDGEWCLVGSANWDPRSLRLNFEYVVECYSTELAARLGTIVDEKLRGAREVTRADLRGRRLARKLRDGVAWLAQPYL
jgi:cardiolipin synthase